MFARTERLVLRPGWADDAPALARALNDASIARMLAHLPWPYGPDDADAFLAQPFTPAAPQLLIFLRTAGEPRLIGGIGLTPRGDMAELGYWIAAPYWGLGFATEAGRAVVAAARHSLRWRGLIARHFIDNPASGHVLRKLGFDQAGSARPMFSAARGAEALAVTYHADFACAEMTTRMATPPRLAA